MEDRYFGAGSALSKTITEIKDDRSLNQVPSQQATIFFPFKTEGLVPRYAGAFSQVITETCNALGVNNRVSRQIDGNVYAVTFGEASDQEHFIHPLLRYCAALTNSFNEDVLRKVEGPNWLDDYLANENMGLIYPINMSNVQTHAADADLTPYIARFSKKPPTEEAAAYDARLADLKSALMNGYYDEQYWSDMTDYLASGWGFKDREQTESFLSFLRSELPEYKGVSFEAETLHKIDLIVRKFETDSGVRTFPGFMSELLDKVAEVFPGNDGEWDEITTRIVSEALDHFNAEKLEPKDYDIIRRYTIDEVTPDQLPESVNVKFNGIDTTGMSEDIDFRLSPRRVAFRDVEQGIKPERSLIGGLVAIDMSFKSTLNTERLSQRLLSFADNLESYKGQDIRQTMLDSIDELGSDLKARPLGYSL